MTGEVAPTEPKTAATAYGEFIKEQLEAQVARRKWIEERGLGVITTSAALMGLLFGLAAFVTDNDAFSLPKESVPVLAVAVLVFLIAALLGVVANWPRFYPAATPQGLEGLTAPGVWGSSEDEGLRATARARVAITNRSRVVNTTKAWMLVAALVAQFAGVLLIAVVVWQILAVAARA